MTKLSTNRLRKLEEALPLAHHFKETSGDLFGYFTEGQRDVEALHVPTNAGAEQIRKLQDAAKVCRLL